MKRSDALALAALLLAACASAPKPDAIGGAGASPQTTARPAAGDWPPANQPLRDEEDRDPRWRY